MRKLNYIYAFKGIFAMHITIGIVHSIHTVWLSNRGYIKVYLKRWPRLVEYVGGDKRKETRSRRS